MIGVNWGSSFFRAYRMDAGGALVDEYRSAAGIVSLDRPGMAAMIDDLASRWPDAGPILISGMIGSNVGWTDVAYAEAPVGGEGLAAACLSTRIGEVDVRIVPGIACSREFDGMPDVLRGEEIELLGLGELGATDGFAVLPGTHTKWVRLEGGRIVDFFTSICGEMFDRLTAQGLLASIVEGEARAGPWFDKGVAAGLAGDLGLGTLLFGARALVVRGAMPRGDAASYIRGLLIGADIGDARTVFPRIVDARMPIVGDNALSRLYANALASAGIESFCVESRDACLRGFQAIGRAVRG
jgi:2-dehydro-3-deoxygalactonokinase